MQITTTMADLYKKLTHNFTKRSHIETKEKKLTLMHIDRYTINYAHNYKRKFAFPTVYRKLAIT